MPASTILLLETAQSAFASIADILIGAGYTVTRTVDPAEAITAAADHQLLITDLNGGPISAIEVCTQLRATPALTEYPVMCISGSDDVEERIRFLEAGADDVIARPFDARELEARVDALLLRFRRSKDPLPVFSEDGLTVGRWRRTAAVYSPKGGVGTTTIATNMAIAAAATRPDKVILIDLALQFGSVATHLNMRPRQTISDLVRDDISMREPELLRGYAVRHERGLHVLAAPSAPEAAETITPDHVNQILATAMAGFDIVIVDAGSTLDERVLNVFEAVDTVILPVYAEITALKAMHALLEYLAETGSVGLKSMFVLNNPFARDILKLRDVESALGAKIQFEVPYEAFLFLKAVNEGIPIVLGAPRSGPAEQFVKISGAAFSEGGMVAPVTAEAKKSGGLFRRRR